LNSRPADYESAALPLSYVGSEKTNRDIFIDPGAKKAETKKEKMSDANYFTPAQKSS
jgi:hypothetical protein